jgi:hypothetical protein
MELRRVIAMAKQGRPDLAALNLGHTRGNGMLKHSPKFLRVIQKYPHSCGERLSLAYLIQSYKIGTEAEY